MQLCGSLSILWHCLSLGFVFKMSTSSSSINNVWKCPFLHIFTAQDFQSLIFAKPRDLQKKKKLSLFHLTVFSSWRWRRQWHPTPVLLPGESHGWRRLVGCSPGVTKSQTQLSDFTFTFHFHALEKEMAPHCSTLAWRIPGMGEPGGLSSMGSHRVGHDWSDLAEEQQQLEKLRTFSCVSSVTCLFF